MSNPDRPEAQPPTPEDTTDAHAPGDRWPSPPAWSPPPAPPGSVPPPAPGWTPPGQQWAPPGSAPSWTWGQPMQPPATGAWIAPPNPSAPWQASGYWAVPPRYRTSAAAVIGAVVLLVLGVLTSLISGFGLIVSATAGELLGSLPGAGEAAALAIVIFAVVLFFGILQIAAATGVFVHKIWARWTGVMLTVLALLLGALMLAGAAADPDAAAGGIVFVLLWIAGYGVTLVCLAGGGSHFTTEGPGR